MTDGTWEVQRAVVAKLKAILPPIAVYDQPPTNADFPYITLTETDSDLSTKSENIQQCLVNIVIWTRYEGKHDCKAWIGKVKAALNGIALTLTGFVHDATWYQDQSLIDDPDNGLTQAIVTFRILITEVP